ncbi:major Facilitator Superfamily protein [Asticcacaulis biprosthecium C19]|uniref:Major Facilitator Superfamily protein n=1 Tax=Asticcacaulis biprosthecium C19 TaxID=715226 RepID=F4QSJ5_9CAUL|nr:MFS transporter [Asticcacaulis biprosthecium]EGF89715.1 major Facilitator Superfamily protein [Asticcacaulis biprosthecium C19]
MSEVTQSQGVPGRHFILILLILVYILNFLDRQIISILAVPIKEEFGISDSQLGWLLGLAFGSVYSVLAIPAAWLADRFSRVWIMTGALAIWSGFTAFCGLAANYSQLFIARMGVGVGEAGGVAPAYSLISDMFPPKSRARALAIYSFGIPVGAAAGVLFGGMIAKAIDWRYAFIIIGIVGLLVAPVFKLLVKEPPRPVNAQKAPPIWEVAGIAFKKPSFWLLSFGAGCSSLVGYGLMAWLPSFLVRSLKFDLTQTSQYLAAILFFGGVAGMFMGGFLADKLGQKNKAAYALIPASAFVVSAPLYAVGTLANAPELTFVLFMAAQALGLVWLGPILTAVQHLGPARSRSQMSALFLLINNLIGLGVGPYFFGKMSDVLKPEYGTDSIKWAFVIGLSFYLVAAVLLVLASRQLKNDWVE